MVVFLYVLHTQGRLDEKSEVFYHHGTQTSQESHQDAQKINKLLCAEVTIPPLEKLFP